MKPGDLVRFRFKDWFYRQGKDPGVLVGPVEVMMVVQPLALVASAATNVTVLHPAHGVGVVCGPHLEAV